MNICFFSIFQLNAPLEIFTIYNLSFGALLFLCYHDMVIKVAGQPSGLNFYRKASETA